MLIHRLPELSYYSSIVVQQKQNRSVYQCSIEKQNKQRSPQLPTKLTVDYGQLLTVEIHRPLSNRAIHRVAQKEIIDTVQQVYSSVQDTSEQPMQLAMLQQANMCYLPPSQKLQYLATQNFRISKWQSWTETKFLEIEKYEEIEKFLWHIIFRSVIKHFPKISLTTYL